MVRLFSYGEMSGDVVVKKRIKRTVQRTLGLSGIRFVHLGHEMFRFFLQGLRG